MKKLFSAITVIAVIAFIWSCQKSESGVENQANSIESTNSLKADTADPTAALELEVIINSSSIQSISDNMSRWPALRLWRKADYCRKLGICKAENTKPPITKAVLIGREINVPVVYDSKTQTFAPIILAFTSSPSSLDSDDIKFYIDEDFDIDVETEMNLPFQKIRFSQAVVQYDSSIGNYGGYVLNISGVN